MKTHPGKLRTIISTTINSAVLPWLLIISIFFVGGCGKKTAKNKLSDKYPIYEGPQYEVVPDTSEIQKTIPDSIFYSNTDTGTVMDKPQIAAYYAADEMKEFYGKRILPPKFDYNMDLSKKTYMELRLLRNAIFARNGYLFTDATLRAYFNQFAWYQPIFDNPDFKVYLSQAEKYFLDKVTQLENAKLADAYDTVETYKMVKMSHVVNLIQYEDINDSLTRALEEKNFALASADNDQLFYVYDKNRYGYIPNFITTDLYLQVLHKYLSSLMEGTEKQKLIPTVTDLLNRLYEKSRSSLKGPVGEQLNGPANWANTYLAVGLSALTGSNVAVESSMMPLFTDEINKVNQANGYGSKFLDRIVFYYSQFEPRGNYTKDDALERYFRCMKWLNSAPMNIDDDDSFLASMMMAYWIKTDEDCRRDFDILKSVVGLLAGEEDNHSVSHLIKLIDDDGIKTMENLLAPQNVIKLRSQVKAMDVNRIQRKAANDVAAEDFAKKFVLFSASRYTFDAEILQRLVNVERPALLRPFPRGLDIFATLGHKAAEDILINEYKETQRWPAFADTLSMLKPEFGHYSNWDATIYTKVMDCVNSLDDEAGNNHPLFMQTSFWQKKNLNTSLAAWTELKHDMILYTEQPYAAEMGEGGGPPPPIQLSYVEPNVAFWSKSIELLDLQEKYLSDIGVMKSESKDITAELKKLAQFLLDISNKELNKEQITEKEFDEMSWIGGEIEQMTFQILGTDHLPEREKRIALAADVYAFNDTVLEEAVGKADEIYVIAEINGLPYLTKGACFSYYEFPSKTRLTDEAWQQLIAEGKTPPHPEWLNSIYVKTSSLKARPGYSINEYMSHGESEGYTP